MEYVIMLFVLIGDYIAFSACKNNKSLNNSQAVDKHNDLEQDRCVRNCLNSGYNGEMKTWLSNYNVPKLIAGAGFC
jgi:hypothetical protein